MATTPTTQDGAIETPHVALVPKIEKMLASEGKGADRLALAKDINARKQELATALLKDEEVRKAYPSIEPLTQRLEGIAEAIDQKQTFKEEMKKQGWGAWTWEKVKSVLTYPKRHPVKTVVYGLLLAAAIAGGVGLYYGILGKALLETIPNYADKVAAVGKEALNFASDKLAGASRVVYDPAMPGPAAPPFTPPPEIPGYPNPPSFPGPGGIDIR